MDYFFALSQSFFRCFSLHTFPTHTLSLFTSLLSSSIVMNNDNELRAQYTFPLAYRPDILDDSVRYDDFIYESLLHHADRIFEQHLRERGVLVTHGTRIPFRKRAFTSKTFIGRQLRSSRRANPFDPGHEYSTDDINLTDVSVGINFTTVTVKEVRIGSDNEPYIYKAVVLNYPITQ